jgi:hypothetical protein
MVTDTAYHVCHVPFKYASVFLYDGVLWYMRLDRKLLFANDTPAAAAAPPPPPPPIIPIAAAIDPNIVDDVANGAVAPAAVEDNNHGINDFGNDNNGNNQ